MEKISEEQIELSEFDVKAVKHVAEEAKTDLKYKNQGNGRFLDDTLPVYDCFKVNCGICVDVCPNRANIKVYDDRFDAPYQIVHIENRCNECDNCHTFCTRGGFPYLKKVTVFADKDEFENSENAGILKMKDNKFLLRNEDKKEYVYDFENSGENKNLIEKILETMVREHPYLLQ